MARDESGAPSNYGAKKSSEYRGSTSGTAAKKKTATRKTVATPGTKVSQATIDKIKAMGMKKALAGAANASPEMREGLKRMYGAKRVAAAGGAKGASASSGGGKYVGSRFVPNTPAKAATVYKSADEARAAAMRGNKPATRMGANTVMAKPTVKSSGLAPKRKPATNPAAKVIVNILSGKGLQKQKRTPKNFK